jgi:hypothetical protein
MAQLQLGKHTIAWFKLAEFVVRKEKERALGMYRLLAYSLPDEGLASQLEGDILLSFADDKAIDAYTKAALSYEKNCKLIQAAAVYEHLIALQPYTIDYAYRMLKLYLQIQSEAKILRSLYILAQALIEHNKLDEIEVLSDQVELSIKHRVFLYEYIILWLLEKKIVPESALYGYVEYIITALCNSNDNSLQLFITKLHALNSVLYSYARDYLAKDTNEL